jgi:nucleotide-binding universal stress UspA family protein
MSWRGVPARTLVRQGDPVEEILLEIDEGKHDMLVLGSPLGWAGGPEIAEEGLVGRVLRRRPGVPVLIVRSQER